MRLHSFVACAAALCVLSTAGIAQSHRSSALTRPQVLGAAEPTASTHFSVFLPLTNKAALMQLLADQSTPTSPSYHKWITPAQFKAQFGPNSADLAAVKHKLESSGFTVTAEHTRSLEVTGSVSAVEHLFSTHIQQVRLAKGNTRFAAASHTFTLPAELARAGAVIPSFRPHLAAHVHSERLNTSGRSTALLAKASLDQRLSSADAFFYPNDMKEAYDFASFTTKVTPKATAPSGSPVQIVGLGAKIGIVISSTVLQSDINRAFQSSVSSGSDTDVQNFTGNTTLPIPTVTIEPVDGGSGSFNAGTDDADEASLDTQMSLGTAPGVKEIVYDMPDLTDESILDAYTQVDEDNSVDVVSSSFGECELDFTAAANGGEDFTFILGLFDDAFAQGSSQGITFVASSGDNGAVPCTSIAFDNNPTNGTNFVLGVENPASDPNVTAVGGTNLQAAATPTINDSAYVSENANYDPRVPAQFELSDDSIVSVGNNTWGSGGGYSIYFSKPSYQNYVNTGSSSVRAVPDVSLMMGGCPGDADLAVSNCEDLPRSAAIVWIGGAPNLLIGTSSSAPQMAGVIALSVELNGGRVGNINTQLYSLSALQSAASAKTASLSQFFHRATSGNNNGYTVVPGQAYSTVLGNGTLFVKNYLQIQSAAAAGTPNTPSNP